MQFSPPSWSSSTSSSSSSTTTMMKDPRQHRRRHSSSSRHHHHHHHQQDDHGGQEEVHCRLPLPLQLPLHQSQSHHTLRGGGCDGGDDAVGGRTATTSRAASSCSTTLTATTLRTRFAVLQRWLEDPRRRSVGAVLFASFLSLLGFTMAGPLTPALGKHFALEVGTKFGSLTSAYPLGMLLGISFWPSLSDKIGRRPVLTLSLAGSGVGLLAQAMVVLWGGSLEMFLVARVATGLFSGASPVSKAYLADVGSLPSPSSSSSSNSKSGGGDSNNSKLPRYLALKDASSTMAFILGPAFGGILYDILRRTMHHKAATATATAASAATATAKATAGRTLLSKSDILDTTSSLSVVIAVSAVASILASVICAVFVKESSTFAVAAAVAADTKPAEPTQTRQNDDDKTNDDESSSTSKAATAASVRATQEQQQQQQQRRRRQNDTQMESSTELSCPLGVNLWAGVASVCFVSFLFNVGDSTFHAFYSAFLRQSNISTGDIGLLFTCLACISFTVSSTSSSRLLKRYGAPVSCAGGLSLVGSGLLMLGILASSSSSSTSTSSLNRLLRPTFTTLAGAAGLYYCGVPVYGPTIPTMLLKCVPPNKRGFILGLDGSINTLARIVTPLIMGEIYRRYGAGTTFVTAGMAVMAGAIITSVRRYVTVSSTTSSDSSSTLTTKQS